ncbi:hypothetical protein [Parendozoicomonas haliclonae]|uniref:Uncharacterized protein n=1 Tax=Parendozoicomonas haliclonae TaxID=1960125 RepID=A0A1X7AQ57_9GAMM|nr:hypothetical protein [Parendozoicomonas haliclonae]SMA50252.1 hypothetical protein EHSB41UT_04046 [Parendozoicomonas haliclonae]
MSGATSSLEKAISSSGTATSSAKAADASSLFVYPLAGLVVALVLAVALSSSRQASAADGELPPALPVYDLPMQEDTDGLYHQYNNLLRNQMSNLWGFVENAAVSRAIWHAVHDKEKPAKAQTRDGGWFSWGWLGLGGKAPLGEQLVDVLKQINIDLRSNPDGKKFLLTKALYDGLADVLDEKTIKGVSRDNLSDINVLIDKIEQKSKSDIQDIIFNVAAATGREKRGAKNITPAASKAADAAKKYADATQDPSAPSPEVITRRMNNANSYTDWRDHLLRQALAGAMLGAGVEAVITVTYKSAYDGKHPWNWDEKDKAEVATAAFDGAVTGGVSTAATYMLTSKYPGVPLWVSSALVTGSIYLVKESVKIAAGSEDAASMRDMAQAVPMALALSLSSYIGESACHPVPLLGAIAGALTGRLAIGVASNLLEKMIEEKSSQARALPFSQPDNVSVKLLKQS